MIIPSAKETIENIEKQKIITSNIVKQEVISGLKTIKSINGSFKIYKGRFDNIIDRVDFIKQLNESGYKVSYGYETWDTGSADFIYISIPNDNKEVEKNHTIKQNNQTLLITAIIFGIILSGMYFSVINFK